MKKYILGILGVIFVVGIGVLIYTSVYQKKILPDTQLHKVGDTWIDGNWKYTVTERRGLFYMVGVSDNRPECDQKHPGYDAAGCQGGGYWAKDGESWVQSTSESWNCEKLSSLGFPKDFPRAGYCDSHPVENNNF